jgi:hypothetical protein
MSRIWDRRSALQSEIAYHYGVGPLSRHADASTDVDRPYHLLHAIRQLPHVLVGRRVSRECRRCDWDTLHRSQLLCPRDDGPPEDLEVQLGDLQVVRYRLEDAGELWSCFLESSRRA